MGFHLNVHFRMTPVNARGGGGESGGASDLEVLLKYKVFPMIKIKSDEHEVS